MADGKRNGAMDLGVYGRNRGRGLSLADMVAIALSVIWLVGCAVFFVVLGGTGPDAGQALRFVLVLVAVVLPVAVIWLAASAARSVRVMRDESARLRTTLEAMRQTHLQAQKTQALAAKSIDFSRKLEEIAQAQRHTEQTIATFASSRPDGIRKLSPPERPSPFPTGAEDDDQASLPLDTPEGAVASPIAIDDLIRAVNFPESAEDVEGFAALRRALSDRKVASLIQAAQDVLTLLSQDSVYMDDLRPDRARPEVWRRFAQGERGRAVAALGGVRDRSSLALTAARMKQDTIFRDAVHHFLRRFDEVISEFEPRADDSEMSRLGDTRTARAFMLLGRVTGTFD
ncbi:hypothetical protein [Maritimibacter fusiformis]|uniref:Uncharacterized protein n=1 Tax=Maritimibacter fusiformis TaxID=2603819 RepID=A0A5D0RGL5_9RHOB|nr:hypothetical protein [Maritimibacter fusiformis]TYB79975.1 hypothetical protein FVF75_14145 [Maritimibacter fusiformis]